jgi:hypothetical protein
MPVAKKSVKKVASSNSSAESPLGGGMGEIVENIAVSMLDKNKDGNVKDDLLTMALDFIKTKFMKK